jgi:hypothetical protein
MEELLKKYISCVIRHENHKCSECKLFKEIEIGSNKLKITSRVCYLLTEIKNWS